MPRRENEHIVLQVLDGEIIQADGLSSVPATVNVLNHQLLPGVVVVELGCIRLVIGLFLLLAQTFKIRQVQALARRIPVFVNILHVAIHRAELHQEFRFVEVLHVSVDVGLNARLLLIPTIREVTSLVEGLAKDVIVLYPHFGLLFSLLLLICRSTR